MTSDLLPAASSTSLATIPLHRDVCSKLGPSVCRNGGHSNIGRRISDSLLKRNRGTRPICTGSIRALCSKRGLAPGGSADRTPPGVEELAELFACYQVSSNRQAAGFRFYFPPPPLIHSHRFLVRHLRRNWCTNLRHNRRRDADEIHVPILKLRTRTRNRDIPGTPDH